MFEDKSKSQFKHQTKYPCLICYERVKMPMICIQCSQIICHSHIRKIQNKCPYCRLTPFQYKTDSFLEELVNFDRKRQEQRMIQAGWFKCLVEGCNFQGKYHKMDLHRRKCHRNQQLRSILFAEDREKAQRLKALTQLIQRMQQKQKLNEKINRLASIVYLKSNKKVTIQKIISMLQHLQNCKNQGCQQIFIQAQMCFIGKKKNKEISGCHQSQQFLTFY